MIDAVPSAWNLANVVTVLRIALVPFFARALLVDGGHTTTGRLIATALFVVAAATDRVDGWLARRSGQVTDLGKMLDPIADKVLIGTALVLLSWLGDLPWWVTVSSSCASSASRRCGSSSCGSWCSRPPAAAS